MARPVGSKTKPQISDFVTREETERLVNIAKEKAEKGDIVMLKFILEQIFGRPAQKLEHSGEDGNPIPIQISSIIADKNGLTSSASTNSEGQS